MNQLGLTVIVGLLLIAFVFGLVIWLLVLNNTRRIGHHLEMAELKLARERELMQSEREARAQTMQQIGRELHDNLGHQLTVVQFAVERVQEEMADPRMEEVITSLERSIEELRLLSRSFNVDLWVKREFPEAVEAEVARMKRAGVRLVRFENQGEWPPMEPGEKVILFRIYQELMNNALKHGGGSAIHVRISADPHPTLEVSDHGPGIAAEEVGTIHGLANIRHRCGLIGFRAELTTAQGAGCTWRIVRNGELKDPHRGDR